MGQNLFSKQTTKLKRTSELARIMSKYGFEEFRSKLRKRNNKKDFTQFTANQEFYQRIRKALEEAGPTFIKFGQTLSTREDLFPSGLILELKKLQDNVVPEEIDLFETLANELQIEPNDYFSFVDPTPIASASIAQVYKAKFRDGRDVILKIKRKNILEIVDADLLLLRDIIRLLTDYYKLVREVNLIYVFEAFAESLYQELSFVNEVNNIELFARNFKEKNTIRCMKVFREFSNDNIICLSYIEGFKINSIEGFNLYKLSIDQTLDKLVELYLDQVLEYGFFHADPHPGNILITPKGKIAFIDMGAMGKILPKDRELIEDFVFYFIQKDANKMMSIIKKMAIQIDILNEKTLERAIEELMYIIENQKLEDIDIKALFTRFSHILNKNNIIMPNHIYLLVKGMVLLEGIGRELNPQINVVEKIKPYIKKITHKEISFEKVKELILSSYWETKRAIKTGPTTISKITERLSEGEFQVQVESKLFNQYRNDQLRNNSLNRYLILICLTFLGACLLADVNQTQYWGVSIISWVLFFITSVLGLLVFLKIIKIPK